ncbi:MAG: polyprenyl synthetase family protein [Lachnospiraceae bacterium]|nr:polyprenyl synthetase family protein [Lachnospiraceae bacterium]
MSFKEKLNRKTEEVNQILKSYLPEEKGFSESLIRAMNYSMTAGGKRIRPILLHESFLLFGGEGRLDEPFMAAIEMIHTHSLIHDDLPAIDNDEYRRGKKTTHAAFGEALGVLSGDALLNYAYETALEAVCSRAAEDALRGMNALKILSDKTGIYGMLGGQSVDVMNEKNQGHALSGQELDYIYKNKTAALLEAPLMAGAVLAGASREETALMEQVGRYTGLAFQIQDDILDLISTTEELGKPVHSDEKNQKTTYVTLCGIDGAAAQVQALTEKAAAILDALMQSNCRGTAAGSEKGSFLRELILYMALRKK